MQPRRDPAERSGRADARAGRRARRGLARDGQALGRRGARPRLRRALDAGRRRLRAGRRPPARPRALARADQARQRRRPARGRADREPAAPHRGRRYTLRQAARAQRPRRRADRADPAPRWGSGAGPPRRSPTRTCEMLRYAAAMLDAGLPLAAFLQLLRVYGQAIAQIADAEVRLIHLYVHEPLMRAGVPSVEIAEEMEGLARELLPFAAPFMGYLHGRLLAHFVEQDMIGHIEAELGEDALEEGRLRVAIAFADLAGYARLTVERGDEAAVGTVERFVEAVGQTLPADARVIKTLGDEVMVVGSDAAALTGWAVELQAGIAAGDPAAADRASTTARRSTATATTTGARSTRPRASSPGPAAARCSSRGRSSTLADGRRRARVRAHRRGEPEGLLRADRAVHRARARGAEARWSSRGDPRGACRAATGLFARDRPVARDALRRARLDLPARRRRRAAGRRRGAARCTSTTACAAAPTTTSATARRCASSWASSCERRAAGGPPASSRASDGGAATCRRGRASCATREAERAGRRARRADRHRAHRQRPGRDDPLPAGRLARAGGRCWGWPPARAA